MRRVILRYCIPTLPTAHPPHEPAVTLRCYSWTSPCIGSPPGTSHFSLEPRQCTLYSRYTAWNPRHLIRRNGYTSSSSCKGRNRGYKTWWSRSFRWDSSWTGSLCRKSCTACERLPPVWEMDTRQYYKRPADSRTLSHQSSRWERSGSSRIWGAAIRTCSTKARLGCVLESNGELRAFARMWAQQHPHYRYHRHGCWPELGHLSDPREWWQVRREQTLLHISTNKNAACDVHKSFLVSSGEQGSKDRSFDCKLQRKESLPIRLLKT